MYSVASDHPGSAGASPSQLGRSLPRFPELQESLAHSLEAPDSSPPWLPNNPSICDRETSSNGCNRARGNADTVSWGVRKEALRVVIPKNREYLRREKVRVFGPTQQPEFNPFTRNVNGIIPERGQKSSRFRSWGCVNHAWSSASRQSRTRLRHAGISSPGSIRAGLWVEFADKDGVRPVRARIRASALNRGTEASRCRASTTCRDVPRCGPRQHC